METIKLWACKGDAVRQAIELGAFVHRDTASAAWTDAVLWLAIDRGLVPGVFHAVSRSSAWRSWSPHTWRRILPGGTRGAPRAMCGVPPRCEGLWALVVQSWNRRRAWRVVGPRMTSSSAVMCCARAVAGGHGGPFAALLGPRR